MTYGKNKAGLGVITLSVKETASFDTERTIKRHTRDKRGKAVIRVQMVRPIGSKLKVVVIDEEGDVIELSKLTITGLQIVDQQAKELVEEIEAAHIKASN